MMKKLWQLLDGHKSAISATLSTVYVWVLAKGWLNETDALLIAGLLSAWAGVAVGDNIRKAVQK